MNDCPGAVNAETSENPSGYKNRTAIISAAGATSSKYFNELDIKDLALAQASARVGDPGWKKG
ncbi:hypothetical protein NUBL21974_31860 [Klebsiella quasipneumoniae]|nr:hypothetical protein NUBL21974_31860 [Klebsiella quasipneumoniae]GKO75114.1 hypothetical protein NUBL21977_48360 [Klebsiella quasipneumoniae]